MEKSKPTSSLHERAKVLKKVVIDVDSGNIDFVVKIKKGKIVLGQAILSPINIQYGYEDNKHVFEIKFKQQLIK